MKNVIEEIEHKGLTIKIIADVDVESPREWDNLGTMVYWHRSYKLGDVDGKKEYGTPDVFEQEAKDKRYVMLPLYLYDHSGLRMSTGSFAAYDPGEWDSGQVGYIYVDRERIKKEYSVKRVTKETIKKVIGVLESEVSVYDQYLSGDVYGAVVEDADGENLDSCWGFYGLDYAIEQGKEMADWQADKIAQEARIEEDVKQAVIG